MQVEDDHELLDLMVADHIDAPDQYRATARWLEYSDRFLAFLKTEGLNNFRSSKHEKGSPGSVLASFGAVDINPPTSRASPEEMYHAAASCFVGHNAVSIDKLPASKVGAPEGFVVEDRFYTLSWLNFYCRYAYVSKFVSFDDQIIVEVGSGSGKQAEMLKKAHPGLTVLIFDLPTQLYVANQYLERVFEGSDQVAGYRQTRNFTSMGDIQRGKINAMPHWKFPLLDGAAFDVLWNAASFQEMGHETALTYLRGATSARSMFLMHNIKYRPGVPPPGIRGVIDQKYLPGFDEVDRSHARLALTPAKWIYFDSFWRRT
ncbi:putative sugar O-methyltransferase [Nitratireductor pacificus]|uniref:Sugar O-methyltransferase n=1 Tax=Nitratireductor pacificus pht-3B TaxID=391937 RepID=K2MIF8_9HYPH|nr:putative sugar O-methyltransferase [Nitratireductor pacificus]EKF16942.1 hypothetical protein NA2_20577 [Nitratireductor pacificus pht-3B]